MRKIDIDEDNKVKKLPIDEIINIDSNGFGQVTYSNIF